MECPKCNHVFTPKKKKPSRKRCFKCNEFIEKHDGITIYNCDMSPSRKEYWHKKCWDKINYCYKCKEWKDDVITEKDHCYGVCKECQDKEKP